MTPIGASLTRASMRGALSGSAGAPRCANSSGGVPDAGARELVAAEVGLGVFPPHPFFAHSRHQSCQKSIIAPVGVEP